MFLSVLSEPPPVTLNVLPRNLAKKGHSPKAAIMENGWVGRALLVLTWNLLVPDSNPSCSYALHGGIANLQGSLERRDAKGPLGLVRVGRSAGHSCRSPLDVLVLSAWRSFCLCAPERWGAEGAFFLPVAAPWAGPKGLCS